MLTALKKRLGPNASSSTSPTSSSDVHRMSAGLQRRFGRGVRFNLKVLVRGDRAVGKSALIRRLEGFQGHEDSSQYVASEQIGVASIHWTPEGFDDQVVKVEVWDVVDVGKKRVPLVGLKLDNENSKGDEVCLDAQFVDVYKGSHGVVFLFDVTKAWTLDYVLNQLNDVPPHLPILVLANFIDRQHHRVVSTDMAKIRLEEAAVNLGVNVRYAESSMTNGFGLRYLHRFLLLPFLLMQKQSLLAQLDANMEQTERARQSLSELEARMSYDDFSNELNNRRRETASKLSPKPTTDVVVGAQKGLETHNGHVEAKPVKTEEKNVDKEVKNERKRDENPTVIDDKHASGNGVSDLSSVDDFVPPSTVMDNFLSEDKENPYFAQHEESDDDDEVTANPMVARVHDDVDDSDDNDVTNLGKGKEEYEEI